MVNEQSNHPDPQGTGMSASDETTNTGASQESSQESNPTPSSLQNLESGERAHDQSSISPSKEDEENGVASDSIGTINSNSDNLSSSNDLSSTITTDDATTDSVTLDKGTIDENESTTDYARGAVAESIAESSTPGKARVTETDDRATEEAISQDTTGPNADGASLPETNATEPVINTPSISIWDRAQPIVLTALAITFSTVIQGTDTGIAALTTIQTNIGQSTEATPESDNTNPPFFVKGWIIIQPILVGVGIFGLGWLKRITNWLLVRVDADVHAAVNEGRAPTLRDRIQSTTIGTRVWDIFETIWKIWTQLLNFLRNRLFPDTIKQWSNVSITALFILIVFSIGWLTSALSPTPIQSPTNDGGDTSTVAQKLPTSTQPGVPSQKSAPPSRTVILADTLKKQFSKKLASQYGDEILQNVEVSRSGDRLLITLGQPWYAFSEQKQQQLVNMLLKYTQDAKLQNLSLLNLDGVRIGRNAVVGNDMIFFQTVPPKLENNAIEEPNRGEGEAIEKIVTEDSGIKAIEETVETVQEAETTDNLQSKDLDSENIKSENIKSEVTQKSTELDLIRQEAAIGDFVNTDTSNNQPPELMRREASIKQKKEDAIETLDLLGPETDVKVASEQETPRKTALLNDTLLTEEIPGLTENSDRFAE